MRSNIDRIRLFVFRIWFLTLAVGHLIQLLLLAPHQTRLPRRRAPHAGSTR